jgi:hypothetical protein
MQETKEWGEFFPVATAPFGYNESKASEWYPLSKKEVLHHGWAWSEYEAPHPQVAKTIPASRLPPSIAEIPDSILQWAIVCEKTGKPFKIIRQELDFYRRSGLPVPHREPKQRHYDRLARTNPCKLFARECAKCKKDIQTTYAPDRPEKVYCEECYLKEVY